jgi:nitrite reductase (NADH) small subunit
MVFALRARGEQDARVPVLTRSFNQTIGIKMFTELDNAIVFNLGPVERIPLGEGRDFQIGEEEIAIFRARDNRVFALQSTCPHRSGPLADGIIGNGIVVCPLHSYKFKLATGRPIGNDCESIRTYAVEISGAGEIILALNVQVVELAEV